VRQQPDASSHSSDNTLELVEEGKLSERGLIAVLNV
jgi:hypothetical protein